MSARFENKTVVVTGGTGALGAAVVDALLGEGASVRIPVFHLHELSGFAHADDDRVVLEQGIDLRAEASVEAYYAGLDGLWASIHVAGGFDMAPALEMPMDHFEDQWRMNVATCFLCCREAGKRMAGGGRIVNVAARPALTPAGGMVGYTTAKAGVASLTACLADEWKGRGILVNAIAPSVMDTPTNREGMPDADHDAWPKLDEVAEAICFLASPQNTLTSGAVVPVYGRA